MSDSDFELFTEADQDKLAYGACLAGWTASGAIVGGVHGGVVLSLPASVVGAAGGLAWGLLTCKSLSPMIKRKLQSSGALSRRAEMTERELSDTLLALRRIKPSLNKDAALDHLAAIRLEIARNRERYQEIA